MALNGTMTDRTRKTNWLVFIVTVLLIVAVIPLSKWGSDVALTTYSDLMKNVYIYVAGLTVLGVNASKTAQRAKAGNPTEPADG